MEVRLHYLPNENIYDIDTSIINRPGRDTLALIYIYRFPKLSSTRDPLLIQTSLLCPRANARFGYLLPLCSPRLARCSLMLSLCSLMLPPLLPGFSVGPGYQYLTLKTDLINSL